MNTRNWKPREKEIPKRDGTPILFVLEEPTPPFPEIPQELLDNPHYIGPDSEEDEGQRWCYAGGMPYTLDELGDDAWQTGCPLCGDNCLAEASPEDLKFYEEYLR